MTIPADSIVAHTLGRMQQNLERRADNGDVSHERSGLLFMGNVHDAFGVLFILATECVAWTGTA